MTEIKIYPAAECVRLMDPDELASLAASIDAHGQRDPIILGRVNGAASEMLVDGRNRLRACEIAGIEPRFEVMQFEDDEAVKAFVADKSEHRNITKGQKAMRIAWLWPEAEKGGKGKRSRILDSLVGSRKGWTDRISQARAVLRHSRELAEAVREGTVKLDETLDRIKAERKEMELAESKLDTLRNDAPDLADLVDEDRISLAEAAAAHEQRKAEAIKIEQSKRDTLIRVAATAYSNVLAIGVAEFAADIEARLNDKEFRAELLRFMRLELPQFSTIDDGAAALKRLVETLKEG